MTGVVGYICRHPIKGHGTESLFDVGLTAGEGFPWDRHWAVAHDAARLVPGWNPCHNFARGAKAPALMAITSTLDTATATVTLHHPDRGTLIFRPDDPADLSRFLDWVGPLNPAGRAQPARIVTAGRVMSDTDFPSISLISMASLHDLNDRMGMVLSPLRWRANVLVGGVAPFAEFDWVGKRLRIGKAVIEVVERITRCKATMANPDTGVLDADTLGGLNSHYGHQDMGVYARVIESGSVWLEDDVVLQ